MKRAAALLVCVLLAACGNDIGDECEDRQDCDSIPNGYCAQVGVCAAPCDALGALCGDSEDAMCAEVSGRRVCLQSCASSDDCTAGGTCSQVEGGRVCIANSLDPPP